jgi:hypothetical protein
MTATLPGSFVNQIFTKTEIDSLKSYKMKAIKIFAAVIFILLFIAHANAIFSQTITWNHKEFETKNVTASLVQLNGERALKVERDLKALPFDTGRLETTVDEPTYVKLKNFNLRNGTIEVKVLSQIQNPSPFKNAQGFIGIAFRISEQDSAFECIYLRPKVGRSDNQMFRNHAVQYFAYPNYKFQTLIKL